MPPEAVAIAVRPAGSNDANDWITTHEGHPDYVVTVPNAQTNVPDKQWITIDTNPASPHYGRVYAMWTIFVLNPSVVYESHADANPDGTHSDWTAPQELPTVKGKRWDTYLLPHVAPDGTVYTTITNNPQAKGFLYNDIYVVWSEDGGESWEGPLTVIENVAAPTYQNTTFRQGIVDTFAVGNALSPEGSYPLYVSFEDGSSGLSNVYVTASMDGGEAWTTPIQVNDNAGSTEALQPNLHVAPNGTVAVTSMTGASPARRAGMPTSPARGSPSTRVRTAASRTTASTRRSSSTSPI